MTRNLPHLTWLRAFEASARHLSFTNAAAELNMTQAAISKQVKLLEHYLGEPLFERKARSLVLTKIGAAYLPKVRDSFERLAAGTEEVFGLRQSGVLTLRAPVAFSANWIAPRLPRFFDRHPDIELRIVSSAWGEGFEQERFDLDVRYGTGKWSGSHSQRLTWEVLEPVCAPSLQDRLHHLADLAGFCLLHVIGYEEGWGSWLQYVKETSVTPGQGLQFDNSLLAMEYATTGRGVALGRSSLSQPFLESGRLIRPFKQAMPLRESFHLLWPENRSEHPHVGLFRNWLTEEAESDPQNLVVRNSTET